MEPDRGFLPEYNFAPIGNRLAVFRGSVDSPSPSLKPDFPNPYATIWRDSGVIGGCPSPQLPQKSMAAKAWKTKLSLVTMWL